MISPEVIQDLNLRYSTSLSPWYFLLMISNLLIFFKLKKVFWIYCSLLWSFISVYYFHFFLSEIHTYAFIWTVLFFVQALLVFFLKGSTTDSFNKMAIALYLFFVLIPFSLFLEDSKESILLFGWGPLQTAIGTIVLLKMSKMKLKDYSLVIIPTLWVFFEFFLL
jgi:hypothetical protein